MLPRCYQGISRFDTTNVPAFIEAAGATLGPRLGDVVPKPSGTLLGVASLSHPDALIELEATAVE